MKKGILLFIVSLICVAPIFAQQSVVKGRVFDRLSGQAISYANISLYKSPDSTFLTGAISNERGVFRIEDISPGKYYLNISFVGYQTVFINNISIEKGTEDVGLVLMDMYAENLGQIDVKSKKSSFVYKVDKKIIDADNYPGANVAMDLLENIPSLEVDFEGRLTYRGDGNFKVYINGRPVANGEEKLRQMPVEQIDKIEVVTNPSARYDSEGNAGIIHVLLKKTRLEGYSISASGRVGTQQNADLSFSVDKKSKKSGWYINGNVGNYVWGEYSIEQFQQITNEDGNFENTIYRQMKYGGVSGYLEAGFNFDITENDYLDFSAHINPFKQSEYQYSDGNYSEISYDENMNFIDREDYINNSRNDLYYQYTGASMSYEHSFNKKRTHVLSTFITFSTYLRNMEDKLIETKEYKTFTEQQGYIAGEQNETIFNAELTYKVPLSETFGMEIGGKVNTDHIPESTSESGNFDQVGNITPFPGEPLNQRVVFSQDVYAGFVTINGEWSKFSAQLGGRIEHTDRISDFSFSDSTGQQITKPSSIAFTDFFPSLHLVYNFTEDHQLTLSYSRRIERPKYWKLVPLKQYYSPFAYSTGNSTLLPAYADAIELGYRKSWEKDFIGLELFARQTTEVIQDYTRTDTLNIIYYTPENVGNSMSIGAEFMTGFDLFSWWNLNLSLSSYYYQLDVDVDYNIQTKDQFRLNTRLNNSFALPLSFTLKWDIHYNSPSVTAQADLEGYFYSAIAMKKGFKENTWNLTLSFSNLFTGINYQSVSQGDQFRIETTNVLEPFATIKVSYFMNNQE